jgi:hypothetical protein
MQSLPLELVSLIFRTIVLPSDLCSVLKVNRSFRALCQAAVTRIEYRSAEVHRRHIPGRWVAQFHNLESVGLVTIEDVQTLMQIASRRIQQANFRFIPEPTCTRYSLFRSIEWIQSFFHVTIDRGSMMQVAFRTGRSMVALDGPNRTVTLSCDSMIGFCFLQTQAVRSIPIDTVIFRYRYGAFPEGLHLDHSIRTVILYGPNYVPEDTTCSLYSSLFRLLNENTHITEVREVVCSSGSHCIQRVIVGPEVMSLTRENRIVTLEVPLDPAYIDLLLARCPYLLRVKVMYKPIPWFFTKLASLLLRPDMHIVLACYRGDAVPDSLQRSDRITIQEYDEVSESGW